MHDRGSSFARHGNSASTESIIALAELDRLEKANQPRNKRDEVGLILVRR
jgi:hypothetical protein